MRSSKTASSTPGARSGNGAAFEQGKLTLEQLRDFAAAAGEPACISGKQEKYEQLLSLYI